VATPVTPSDRQPSTESPAPAAAVAPPPPPPESRQSPMMTRLRHWTERLNPLIPEKPATVAAMSETSPFLNTRKMSHSLTRLFTRSFSMKMKPNSHRDDDDADDASPVDSIETE